jgi:hypothetical protein
VIEMDKVNSNIESQFDIDLEEEVKGVIAGLLLSTLGWMYLAMSEKKYTSEEAAAYSTEGITQSLLVKIYPQWKAYIKNLRKLICPAEAINNCCVKAIKKPPHCIKMEKINEIMFAYSKVAYFVAYLMNKRFFDDSPQNLLRAKGVGFNEDESFQYLKGEIIKIGNNDLCSEDVIKAAKIVRVNLTPTNINDIKEFFRLSAGRVK